MKEGVPTPRTERLDDPAKRRFLRGALGVLIATGGATVVLRPEKLADGEQTHGPIESPEPLPRPEVPKFEEYVRAFEMQWGMSPNEIIFIDQHGQPLDDPFPLEQTFIDVTADQEEILVQAIGSDGKLTGRWLELMRAEISSMYDVPAELVGQLNVRSDFAAAEDQFPGLTFNSIAGIAQHHAAQPAAEGESQSRMECLLEVFPQHLDIPDPFIKQLLCDHIVGLVAKESKFNDELGKNSASAQQALQLTDSVRIEHLFKKDPNASAAENAQNKQAVADARLSFPQQVEIAAKHFSNIYKRLHVWLKKGKEVDSTATFDREYVFNDLRGAFSSDEDWQRYMLFPLMLNAYNGGSLLVADACAAFVDSYEGDFAKAAERYEGYDMYFAITRFAANSDKGRLKKYGPDSQSYTANVMAATNVLSA